MGNVSEWGAQELDKQAGRHSKDGSGEVRAKEMAGGSRAIGLFNLGTSLHRV
jgi:hypothetical protein